MIKYAVVIKHIGRDWEGDVRIDIIDAPDDATSKDIRYLVEWEMLGPFEVLFVTQKINLNRKWKNRAKQQKE